MNEIIFREVNRETWADFAGLFESRGGPKSCWCMVWRAEGKQRDGGSRRAAMKSRIDADVPSKPAALSLLSTPAAPRVKRPWTVPVCPRPDASATVVEPTASFNRQYAAGLSTSTVLL